ncbi:putative UDP-rhamnose:rhamnosyltransferase 1 [Capsicum baccatum]|uniref:UDP-rhamnose:rhamnosyltransferase 1 n=1 Tax=Capsicum baccatum TaxID=33114 RepID=A0A2G2VDW9_CAPBA|nr:putative UDP-rhamnose:rhamnosyltransferase 1 [Capsicum baccatum]
MVESHRRYSPEISFAGQLPTTLYEDENTNIDAWREMKIWLDKQQKGKVIYVAFGSETKQRQNELIELALGLGRFRRTNKGERNCVHELGSTSHNSKHDRLPKLPPNLSQLLKFVKLPLPHVEKLPENNAPYEQVKYLKIAHDGLEEPMAKFFEDSAPDFILFDFASYWIPSLASKFNIPTAYFSIFIAAVLSYFVPDCAMTMKFG